MFDQHGNAALTWYSSGHNMYERVSIVVISELAPTGPVNLGLHTGIAWRVSSFLRLDTNHIGRVPRPPILCTDSIDV